MSGEELIDAFVQSAREHLEAEDLHDAAIAGCRREELRAELLRRLQPQGRRKILIECSKCHKEWSYGHVCKPAEAQPQGRENEELCKCGHPRGMHRPKCGILPGCASQCQEFQIAYDKRGCPECQPIPYAEPAEAESSSAGPSERRCHHCETGLPFMSNLPDAHLSGDGVSFGGWCLKKLSPEDYKRIFPASQQVPRQELKADNLFGVYCDGNPMGLPNAPQPIFWDGWQRLADWLNKGAASQQVDVSARNAIKLIIGRTSNTPWTHVADAEVDAYIEQAAVLQKAMGGK